MILRSNFHLYINQLYFLLKASWKLDCANKGRVISPFLFSFSILILFSFVFSLVEQSQQTAIFIGELFLTVLMSTQGALLRVFEPEQEDKAFQVLFTYPVSSSAWYLCKFISSFFGLL